MMYFKEVSMKMGTKKHNTLTQRFIASAFISVILYNVTVELFSVLYLLIYMLKSQIHIFEQQEELLQIRSPELGELQDMLSPCAMNWMFVASQNSYVETLIPSVMVFGNEAFGRALLSCSYDGINILVTRDEWAYFFSLWQERIQWEDNCLQTRKRALTRHLAPRTGRDQCLLFKLHSLWYSINSSWLKTLWFNNGLRNPDFENLFLCWFTSDYPRLVHLGQNISFSPYNIQGFNRDSPLISKSKGTFPRSPSEVTLCLISQNGTP